MLFDAPRRFSTSLSSSDFGELVLIGYCCFLIRCRYDHDGVPFGIQGTLIAPAAQTVSPFGKTGYRLEQVRQIRGPSRDHIRYA